MKLRNILLPISLFALSASVALANDPKPPVYTTPIIFGTPISAKTPMATGTPFSVTTPMAFATPRRDNKNPPPMMTPKNDSFQKTMPSNSIGDSYGSTGATGNMPGSSNSNSRNSSSGSSSNRMPSSSTGNNSAGSNTSGTNP